MSEDWARNYIPIHKQKQQEQQNRQMKASLARSGASSMFQRILDCVRRDLQTFHSAGVLQDLKLTMESMPEKFVVASSSTRLEVELSIVLIKYHHLFLGEDKRPEQHIGTLRICSDLDGRLAVCRNGDEEAFTDESEVSEFLLMPLLNSIDK